LGQPTGLYGDKALKEFAKLSMQMLTLNLPAIAKATAVEDIRTSFRPIEPGRYIVTLFGNVGLLGVKGSNPQIPILGDNSIVIGKGEIVDAGIIDIVSTGSSGVFFKNETARLVGSEAPQPFREVIKRNLPEIYARITYRKFSAYDGLLLPENKKTTEKQ